MSLTDTKKHISEDNLKSEKHLANIEIVSALLERLGWASAAGEGHFTKEDVRTSFAESVVDDSLFNTQKRLIEIFDLRRSYNIRKDMASQQVLMWCKSLLTQLSPQIRASEKTYYLEIQNDLSELLKRKSANGKQFFDHWNLLKLVLRQQAHVDPFLDGGINDDD